MSDIPETITEGELATALSQQVRACAGVAFVADPRKAAEDIFAAVQRNREPEYEPGEIYLSTNGYRYMRLPDSQWLVLYKRGVTDVRPDNQPLKPLRKLVPMPSHDELVVVLTEAITDDVHGYEGQAQRVLNLLAGGGSDD